MRLVLAVVLVMAFGCYDNEDEAKFCKDATDCGNGKCMTAPVSGYLYCADPAAGCATGYRWAGNAGDDLAGECVQPTMPPDAGVTPDGGTP